MLHGCASLLSVGKRVVCFLVLCVSLGLWPAEDGCSLIVGQTSCWPKRHASSSGNPPSARVDEPVVCADDALVPWFHCHGGLPSQDTPRIVCLDSAWEPVPWRACGHCFLGDTKRLMSHDVITIFFHRFNV